MTASETQSGQTAAQLFQQGRLDDAIFAQTNEVKENPADPARRLFLFELLTFAGQFERAEKQLGAVQYNDMERDAAVATFRRVLAAEQERRALYGQGRRPRFLGPVPEHAELRLKALDALREGRAADAAQLVSQAHEKMPEVSGLLNQKPFKLLCDCDDVFGSILEVVSGTGAYFWVPLEQVDLLLLAEPKYPRDLLWIQAHLEIKDGPSGDVFLPATYPGTWQASEDAIRLGRATDWQEVTPELVRGIGSRLFLVDEEALPLLDWRELQIAG
jgi:type VI secretion system protein ImpE